LRQFPKHRRKSTFAGAESRFFEKIGRLAAKHRAEAATRHQAGPNTRGIVSRGENIKGDNLPLFF